MNLNQSINLIKGIGPAKEQQLNNIGIYSIKDFLYYFPRTWIDFSKTQDLASSRIDEEVIVKAKIIDIQNQITYKRRIVITRALVESNDYQIYCQWFNQPFITNILKKNSTWIFYGKIGYDFKAKQKIFNVIKYTQKEEIIPIYRESGKLNTNFFAKTIKDLLLKISIQDFFEKQTLNEYELLSLDEAITNIHFPKNKKLLYESKKRLSFDELFILSLKTLYKKHKYKQKCSPKINIYKEELLKFVKKLPFDLTKAQHKSIYEILTDLSKPNPMIRLLNGDVGSGKTIVAVIAAYMTALNNYQAVIMAPTEILANQHYEKFINLFKKTNIKISLITSSSIKNNCFDENKNIKKAINADIVIGTHSLIQKNMHYDRLALIIIDEEHRFGVKQRASLIKLSNCNLIAHYLAMSATAIPRTLAQAVYGNMDISILDELPKGRKKIITKLVNPTNRDKAYQFIRQQIINGRQVFVICPLIENKKENEDLFGLDKKTVIKEYEKLKNQIFPEFEIMFLHGKLKPKEKQKNMSDFVLGKADILVSTSVVEVGVDIPNASIMLIEDADRFGLAQLHQFRGRVGRGLYQSYCLLFSNSLNLKTQKRLMAMEKYNDGFKLANIDLVTRGPGEFVGSRQSGFLDLKIAKITDTILLNQAKSLANMYIKNNIQNYPNLFNLLKNDKK